MMLFDDDIPVDDEDGLFGAEEKPAKKKKEASLFDEEPEESFSESEDGEKPPPRAHANILGHGEIEERILHMLESGRFPHGLIFSGPQGVGKATMAYRLARYLIARTEKEAEEEAAGPSLFGLPDPNPAPSPMVPEKLYIAPDHPVFAHIASGGHPDFHSVERRFDEKTGRLKSTVEVEEIRKIAPFMRMTPSVPNGWRIVIIDDADTMNRSSQNALLKILEEPPKKALLILVVHRLGALLPTILSRCSVIPFHPLGEDEIRPLIEKKHLSPALARRIAGMAEGSPGRAIGYAKGVHAALSEQIFAFLSTYPRFDWTAIQLFADSIGGKAQEEFQNVFQETLLWTASALVRIKATGQGGEVFADLPGLQTLQNSRSLGDLLKISDALKTHFETALNGNLDKRYLVMGAFMALEG
jgi:DNA polymerase-3 subunit delta'